MKTKRIVGVAAFVFVAALCGLLYVGGASESERSKVRKRYGQMRRALSSGDTNAATLLFAPPFRARASDHFDRLSVFARELNSRSKITVRGEHADICPERIYPWLPFITAGHSIEMINIQDEWYFTGELAVW